MSSEIQNFMERFHANIAMDPSPLPIKRKQPVPYELSVLGYFCDTPRSALDLLELQPKLFKALTEIKIYTVGKYCKYNSSVGFCRFVLALMKSKFLKI